MVEIDRLGMPGDLPFAHIPEQRRLVCIACGCGGRNVQVMRDWPRVPGGAAVVTWNGSRRLCLQHTDLADRARA
jgi:hypothetical protein